MTEYTPVVKDILSDPDRLRELLKEAKGLGLVPPERAPAGERAMKESIKITEKFDRHSQFTGCIITVVHKRVGGKKTFSIRANGRSKKDTLVEAEQEAARLSKRYKIQ